MFQPELTRLRARIEVWGREDLTYFQRATLSQIEAWERALGATLPEHYREFLLQIGDGFIISRQSCHLLMLGIDKGNSALDFKRSARLIPFPLQSEIYDNYMHSCRSWEELTGHEKMESDVALALGYHDWTNFALIVTGPQRGEVWQFSTFTWNPKVCDTDLISAIHVMLDGTKPPTIIQTEMHPFWKRICAWTRPDKR